MYQRTKKRVPCYILACTREKNPDIGLFEVSQETMDQRLKELIAILPDINAIKTGQKEPTRCGHCEVCRKTHILTGPVSLEVL